MNNLVTATLQEEITENQSYQVTINEEIIQ